MIVTCSKVQAKNAEWLLLATTFSYTRRWHVEDVDQDQKLV